MVQTVVHFYCNFISIHAPTRGATTSSDSSSLSLSISIHAPTRGATYFLMSFTTCSSNFNPRSYKRSDGLHPHNIRTFLYFNPRSYKRSDLTGILGVCGVSISIHAPTRGATTGCGSQPQPIIISIHAPTRGATSLENQLHRFFLISIHAPTRGATFIKLFFDFGGLFQSTLLQEERQVRI